jgi:hypothetical protein
MSIHRSGGGWRVFFPDAKGCLQSISMAFTDLAAPDPYCIQSAGRSYFHIPELLALVRLCAGIKDRGAQNV